MAAIASLLIPMRGYDKSLYLLSFCLLRSYETPSGVMRHLKIAVLDFETGYESPCGVMSVLQKNPINKCLLLRIPMRGYEELDEQSIYNVATALRIPMRGYEH